MIILYIKSLTNINNYIKDLFWCYIIMPVYIDNQTKEYVRVQKKALIDRDLLDCYNRILEKQNVNAIIRSHRARINRMDLHGKNKYKTLKILEHYNNTQDKTTAMSILTNSLNNSGIFRMYLSDEERKNNHWSSKGSGQKC